MGGAGPARSAAALCQARKSRGSWTWSVKRFPLHSPGRARHRECLAGAGGSPGFDVAEPLFDERARWSVDVARHDQARVRRHVVRLEKRHDIVVARRREVRHVANYGPVVRMAFGIEHLAQSDLGHAIRAVLVALAAFVLDDVALGIDGLGRHGVEQESHPIRFEEERQLHGIGRHVDPVRRFDRPRSRRCCRRQPSRATRRTRPA